MQKLLNAALEKKKNHLAFSKCLAFFLWSKTLDAALYF